jgi:hypothetical protein
MSGAQSALLSLKKMATDHQKEVAGARSALHSLSTPDLDGVKAAAGAASKRSQRPRMGAVFAGEDDEPAMPARVRRHSAHSGSSTQFVMDDDDGGADSGPSFADCDEAEAASSQPPITSHENSRMSYLRSLGIR